MAVLASTIPSLAQNEPQSSQPVKLSPFVVTDKKPKAGIEKLVHLFDGEFPSLRSGPMVEAILWRHRYLTDHPAENAVIITDQDGEKTKWATIAFSQEGELYVTSNALGEHIHLPEFSPADLRTREGLEKIRQRIGASRELSEYGKDLMDFLNHKTDVFVVRGSTGGPAETNSNPDDLGRLSELKIVAEESGDYSVLRLAGGHDPVMQDKFYSPYSDSPGEVLDWTYKTLHDPDKAGFVPVALNQVNIEISGKGATKTESIRAIVFDWEGVQYFYHPDRGTRAKPFPRNPVTRLPYLCVKNGGVMENVFFCATFLKVHPAEKVVLVPGDHPAVAFTMDDRLSLFSPGLGVYTLPKRYKPGDIANLERLQEIHSSLLAVAAKPRQQPKEGPPRRVPVPDQMPGDTAEMEMRRAFMALQQAGVPSRLSAGAAPALTFSWLGVTYVYGPDQKVRQVSNG